MANLVLLSYKPLSRKKREDEFTYDSINHLRYVLGFIKIDHLEEIGFAYTKLFTEIEEMFDILHLSEDYPTVADPIGFGFDGVGEIAEDFSVFEDRADFA